MRMNSENTHKVYDAISFYFDNYERHYADVWQVPFGKVCTPRKHLASYDYLFKSFKRWFIIIPNKSTYRWTRQDLLERMLTCLERNHKINMTHWIVHTWIMYGNGNLLDQRITITPQVVAFALLDLVYEESNVRPKSS